MNTRVVIAGAGGFGRELHSALTTSPLYLSRQRVAEVVYIDDRTPTVPVRGDVISSVGDYAPQERDIVLLAIGAPAVRRRVVAMLQSRGARFGTFVHDQALIGEGVELDEGVIICGGVLATSDVKVGAFAQINVNCSIGHDVVIGEYSTLSANCDLTGGVIVGSDAFLGTAVTIAPGKKIGDGAAVGIGSVVIRNVRPHTTVFGNPARDIGRKSS